MMLDRPLRVGLHDAEKDHAARHPKSRAKPKFPNLALMKISAWHKSRGDIVEWWEPFADYDRVYSAKIFTFTPENPYLPPGTVRGGTGYDIKSKLPPEIDAALPDYTIYPDCDFAVGFLTRGCIRRCPWCVVPEKEGSIAPYRTWQEIVRPDTRKLVLMDNNILACEHGLTQLSELAETGYKIDVNQGMDARLVTPEVAKILSRVKWIRYLRFSCDTTAQIEPLKRAIFLLRENGVPVQKIWSYLLVKRDISEAVGIVDALREFRTMTIYAQPERKFDTDEKPTREQQEFAGRYVYGGSWRGEGWGEYCLRRGLGF